jgi:hypothetical protein
MALETKALGGLLMDLLNSPGAAETWIISVCCLADFLAMLAIFLLADLVYGAAYLVRWAVYWAVDAFPFSSKELEVVEDALVDLVIHWADMRDRPGFWATIC